MGETIHDLDDIPRSADLAGRAFNGLVRDLASLMPVSCRHGDAVMFLGNSLEAVDIVRGRLDVMLADPPYGIDYVPGAGGGAVFAGVAIAGDDRPFDPRPYLGLAPVTCLWGANHFASRLPASPGWLVWDKRCGGKPLSMADCELAWTDQRRPARLISRLWSGAVRGSKRGEHWHPTQKSVEVMVWCLEKLRAAAGAIVFDPFAGSGSTGVACLKTGRRFIGIELERRWFDAADRRLASEMASPRFL